MGDEVKRTQLGNNNAYCHDNELTWFDWSLPEKHKTLFRFVKMLITFRLQRDLSKNEYRMNLNQLLQQATISWHGVDINKPDWSENSHSIALTVQSLSGKTLMHYMINAYSKPLQFELPTATKGKEYVWKRWMDTSLQSPEDICFQDDAKEVKNSYFVAAHSMAVLFAQLH
jgi:glycogen operon protein